MKFRILGPLAATILAFAVPALAEKTVGNVVDDTAIATEVKSKMLVAKGVPSTDVNVEVYKAVVLLSGFVETQAQANAAAAVAKGVSGVKEVRNALAVHAPTSFGTKIDDTNLVTQVKVALIGTKDVDAGQINVEARGGIVQLGGFVTSTAMRDRALAVARGVKGAKRVDDAMFVKPK